MSYKFYILYFYGKIVLIRFIISILIDMNFKLNSQIIKEIKIATRLSKMHKKMKFAIFNSYELKR